jgi:CheY-like chemotaxis protein
VLQPQVVDLNSVVDQMRPWLERLIGEDIELTTSLAADYPILSDRGQIEQVIMNLAINARDAMPRGGRLTLETKSVTLTDHDSSAMPKGDCVALVMSDSGAGIAEDVLPRVFEPFFTTKDVGRGTGLGLATVEGIVHQSGGSVRVESVIGQGSTFTILLPRASEATPQARPPAQIPIARGPDFETVLVCDDDDGVRELVANVLKLRAYTVLKARNGKHALAVAEEHQRPIHLLVTDLVMPELGGIELAGELRRKHAQLCVLYISGYTEDVTIVSGQLAPGTSFLPKPFLPSELTRSVCSILEGPQAG